MSVHHPSTKCMSRAPIMLLAMVVALSILVMTALSVGTASTARADGGGGDTSAELNQYFKRLQRERQRSRTRRRSRPTASRGNKRTTGERAPKVRKRERVSRPSSTPRKTRPSGTARAPAPSTATKRRQPTAAELRTELDRAHAALTKDGRTIHQQVEDQKDVIAQLELAHDALDSLTDELIEILSKHLDYNKDVTGWSASPYGEGRGVKKAAGKTIGMSIGLFFTGKVNPYTLAAGFIADGLEGIGRRYWKSVARDEIMKNSKTIGEALDKAMKRYKEVREALAQAKGDLKRLLERSNAVFELSLRYQAAVVREAAEKRKAVEGAKLDRNPGLDGDLEELRKYKAENRRRLRQGGVTLSR